MRRDHPAQVLQAAKHTYFGIEEREVHRAKRNENEGIQNAMDILANYETEHGVTFEALDTEALAELRTFWMDEASWSTAGKDEFVNRVVDLLGLEDAE